LCILKYSCLRDVTVDIFFYFKSVCNYTYYLMRLAPGAKAQNTYGGCKILVNDYYYKSYSN